MARMFPAVPFQRLLTELTGKLHELIEERDAYCAQLEAEHRTTTYGSDSTEQIAKRTASIAELAAAIACVARAANTKP